MTATDDVLARWRAEAQRALRTADTELLEEVAVHLADTWTAVAAVQGADAADAAARADLAQWAVRPRQTPPRERLLTGLDLDVTASLRLLRARPFAAAGSALLIAIAVAAAATAAAVTYGVLGRPLPYPQASRLMTLWQAERGGVTQISYPDYRDLAGTGVFDLSGAILTGVGTVMTNGAVDRVHALNVEPAVLTILGARPEIGRLLTDADGATNTALISHRLWQSLFGGAGDVLGRSFVLSGHQMTVVGVLPEGFDLEMPVSASFGIGRNDVWMGLDHSESFVTLRQVATYQVLARLAPGLTLDEARRRLDAKAADLSRQFPDTNRGRLFPLIPLAERLSASAVRPLAMAAGTAVLVVLIALANVTTLALARAAARADDLTLRRCLGATPWRVARQWCCETAPSAAAGVLAGALSAAYITRVLVNVEAARLPRADAIRFDAIAWLAAAVVGAALTVVPQLIALRLLRRRVQPGSSGARVVSGAARGWRRGLVAAELAFALVLSVGAAATSRALFHVTAVDPGFTPQGALAFRASAYSARYPDRAQTVRFFQRAVEALAAAPGIARASVGSSLPLSG